jgi:hypothetical protein
LSTQLVRSEILRFLSSSDPEVVSIRGAWGVGKTYAWRFYFREAQGATGGIALTRYAYVSLFGINSLEQLKHAIFESTVKTSDLTGRPSFATVGESISTIEKIGRKGAQVVRQLPGAGTFADLLNSSYFLSVRNHIICIDDLERKGSGLSLTDVLGLVSFLKEERNCKVLMLLNSSELPSSDGNAFDLFLEKVVDRSLEFSPTPEECAKIAFDEDDEISSEVSRHVVSLGISNIRVIRKIESIARQLNDALKEYDKEVFRRTLQSTVVLAWAYLQPTVAPNLEYLTTKKAEGFFGLSEEKHWSPEEANWNTLLDAYGYRRTDEFDLVLLKCVQRGYFDHETLDGHAKPMHDEIFAGNAVNLMDKALRLFYGSFSMDEVAVLDAIDKEFRQQAQYVNLNTLNTIVGLFKGLGRLQQASELIDFYVTHRDQGKDGWDLERAYGVDGLDADVRRAFQKKYLSFPTEIPDTEGLLRALVAQKGFDDEIATALAGTTVEEYYNVFKTTAEIPIFLSTIFSFRRIINPTPEMIRIMERATQALRRLGLESRINALRVARYGVDLNAEAPKINAPAIEPREETEGRS